MSIDTKITGPAWLTAAIIAVSLRIESARVLLNGRLTIVPSKGVQEHFFCKYSYSEHDQHDDEEDHIDNNKRSSIRSRIDKIRRVPRRGFDDRNF